MSEGGNHGCAQVSLLERLQNVPKEASEWRQDGDGWLNIPYGRLAHEAIDEIDRLSQLLLDQANHASAASDEPRQEHDPLDDLVASGGLPEAQKCVKTHVNPDKVRYKAIEALLTDANGLLRSAAEIAKREGHATNWRAFRKQLMAGLKRHAEWSVSAEPRQDHSWVSGGICCRAHATYAEKMSRMIVCSMCGDKRCPKADNHEFKCAEEGQQP